MISGILLIILGLLAIPSLILSKKPNAKELFDKIAPFQGWIGIVFAIWGILGIIFSIIGIVGLTAYPIIWITGLLVSIVEAALGFMLGYSLISKYALSKNADAAAKGEQLLKKLLPLQGIFGIIAIVLGIWQIIATILFAVAVAVA